MADQQETMISFIEEARLNRFEVGKNVTLDAVEEDMRREGKKNRLVRSQIPKFKSRLSS